MKVNLGSIDRVLRILAGILLMALAFQGIIGVWGWIGVVLVATGLFRFCPAYSLLGVKTCKVE
jgi:hypothetical protein